MSSSDDALIEAVDAAYARGELTEQQFKATTGGMNMVKKEVCGGRSLTENITNDSPALNERIKARWTVLKTQQAKRLAIRKVLELVPELGSKDDRKRVWNAIEPARVVTDADIESSARDKALFEALDAEYARGEMPQTTYDKQKGNLQRVKDRVCDAGVSLTDSIVHHSRALRDGIVTEWPVSATQRDKIGTIRSALERDPSLGTQATREFWGVEENRQGGSASLAEEAKQAKRVEDAKRAEEAEPPRLKEKKKASRTPPSNETPRDAEMFKALEARRDIAESTKKKYVENLKYIRATLCSEKGLAYDIVNEPWELKLRIADHWENLNTRKSKLDAVKAALNADGELGDVATRNYWSRELGRAFRDAERANSNNVATDRELETMPDLNKLNEVADAMNCGLAATHAVSRRHSMESVWMLLSARTPPKRAQEWSDMGIVRCDASSTTDNYLILPEDGGYATIVMTRFKTAESNAKAGKKVFREFLPTDVSDAVRMSYREWPRMYLFLNENGEPFPAEGTFRNWAARVWEKHLGHPCMINSMRKAWAQEVCDGSRSEMADKIILAKSMHHDVSTQTKAYTHVMQNRPRCECVSRWIEWQHELDQGDPA